MLRVPPGRDSDRLRPDPQQTAELEALSRLAAVRDVLDAFLCGHWELDVELLLLVAAVLDQAGVWCLVAEKARDAA